jgi:hypothetical protein
MSKSTVNDNEQIVPNTFHQQELQEGIFWLFYVWVLAAERSMNRVPIQLKILLKQDNVF